MSDVFISYVEEDSAVAAEAARVLRDGGLTSWRYEADSVGGQNYLLQTRTEIEVCRAFLIVLSPASMASEQVDREVVRAHECGKPFVPVLRDLTYADFARRRPGWQQAMGAATALTVPEDGLAEIGPRIVAGVRAAADQGPAEARRATPPPPATQRLARVLRSRRTRRFAVLVLVLGIGAAFSVHAWNLRREAEDRKAAAEAKLEAIRLLDTGQHGAAQPILDRALALTPQDGEIQVLLGRLHYQNEEPKLAIEHLDRRLREAPSDALARYWRGRTNEALDKLDAVVEDLSVAIASGSLPPDLYIEALFSRGLALLDRSMPSRPIGIELTEAQRRDTLAAEADFSSIVDLRNTTTALVQRGRARYRIGKDADAERDLRSAYRRSSDSGRQEDRSTASDATYFQGLLDLRRARREHSVTSASMAEESFDLSLRANPDLSRSKAMRALAEIGMGYFPAGIRQLEDLMNGLSSDDPQRAVGTSYLEEARKAFAALPVQGLVLKGDRIEGPEGTGAELFATCVVHGRKGVPCRVVLRVFDSGGSPYLYRWRPLRAQNPKYRTPEGNLAVVEAFVPTEDPYRVDGLRLYLPYKETDPFDGEQRYEFTLTVEDDSGPISTMIDGNFTFTSSHR